MCDVWEKNGRLSSYLPEYHQERADHVDRQTHSCGNIKTDGITQYESGLVVQVGGVD